MLVLPVFTEVLSLHGPVLPDVCFCAVHVFLCVPMGECMLSLATGLDLGAGSRSCVASVGLLDLPATNRGI